MRSPRRCVINPLMCYASLSSTSPTYYYWRHISHLYFRFRIGKERYQSYHSQDALVQSSQETQPKLEERHFICPNLYRARTDKWVTRWVETLSDVVGRWISGGESRRGGVNSKSCELHCLGNVLIRLAVHAKYTSHEAGRCCRFLRLEVSSAELTSNLQN